jgi:hypothetical protein
MGGIYARGGYAARAVVVKNGLGEEDLLDRIEAECPMCRTAGMRTPYARVSELFPISFTPF